MQLGTVCIGSETFKIELPSANNEVIPGVCWGAIEAFPTPAYWAYQVRARRIIGERINYRLGTSLKEEVAACLLGGHGIPANIGLSAFHHIKKQGAFSGPLPTEAQLLNWLKMPIEVDGRLVKYRFARQKSHYIFTALQKIFNEHPPASSGKELRNWLLDIPGVGYKTASWIARNWLEADDVAILDIHIFRAGLLGKFFSENLSIERHYIKLEEQFLKLSAGLGVRASELDALIWLEMMSSSSTVHGIMSMGRYGATSELHLRTKKSTTNPNQLPLID